MANNIVQLQDASNNNVYPITHLQAVRDSSGNTLEGMIQDLEEIAVGYFVCDTAGGTAAKTLTIDSSIALSTKVLCKVKFNNKNTVNNATLNINQTGAKALYYNGTRVGSANSWYPEEVVDLYYDGTNYQATSCFDADDLDISAHMPHEVREVYTTTRTAIYSGNVTETYESLTPVSDSSVDGYTRTVTNTGTTSDTTTVTGPTATYNSTKDQTSVVWVTTRTVVHVVSNYTLAEAIAAVPTSYRRGGVHIRFIDASTSKYVQYRYKNQNSTGFTTVGNWEMLNNVSVSQNTETGHTDIKVGDVTTPVASVKDVDKLKQSDAMAFDRLSLGNQYESYYWGVINGAGKWANINSDYQYRLFPVKSGDTIILTAGNSNANYAFLNSIPFPTNGDNADLVTGTSRTDVTRNSTVTVTAPADGYLYVSYMYSGSSTAFASILINDVDVTKDWNYVVGQSVQVAGIKTKSEKNETDISNIGYYKLAVAGTPKNVEYAAPIKAGHTYIVNHKVDSGIFGVTVNAYNGNTLILSKDVDVQGTTVTIPSNATRIDCRFWNSNTGVNPIGIFTDANGIIKELENSLNEKADSETVDEKIEELYEGLGQYNVKVSDGKGIDVPIQKIPKGIYQIEITVESGNFGGNLNGYDANDNLVFSYEIEEDFAKKKIPDCDHMAFYLWTSNTATGTIIKFISFGSILKDNNYEHTIPNYVFTIDNDVRIPVIVYQEGIDKKASNETINGGIGLIVNPKDGSGNRVLRIESKNNYEEKSVTQKSVNSSKNVSGVRLLCIGDSLTYNTCKNPLSNEYDKWRNWVSYMTYLSLIHNKDNNCGVITQLGTRYHNVGFDYKEEHFYQKVCLEAIAGWSAADFLYHPFFMKMTGSSATAFGTPEVWYMKGLATKTPYDADSYNIDYEDWTGSDEQQALLQSTPMGRYKIDHVQSIWDKIKIVDTTFHQGESWTGSAQQKSDVDAWMFTKMENPENHLYSLEQARAYTGSHVWTYDVAMSIEKYLERYRTMDNNGNRLYFDALGSTTGTAGSSNIGYLADGTPTAYYLGTEVSDTMAYNVCEPTHVIIELGTNGGYTRPSMDNLDDILAYMLSKVSYVGYMIPRFDNGVFNIGRWKGIIPQEITENIYNYEINKYMMDKYAGNINNGTKVQYIPAYAVQCPYSSILDTYAINDFGEKTYCQSNADGHIGWLANRDIGLQAYGWLLNTL